MAANPDLFFQTRCVFINNQFESIGAEGINHRCAEFICQYIEPDRFNPIKTFQDWELNTRIEGQSLIDSFKDFAFRIANERLDENLLAAPYYSDFITECGSSYVEQDFMIWANNIEIEQGKVTNQELAIGRATQYFKTWFETTYKPTPDFEEWELELAM